MSIGEDFGGSPAELPWGERCDFCGSQTKRCRNRNQDWKHCVQPGAGIEKFSAHYMAEIAQLREDNARLRRALNEIAQRAGLAAQ